MLHCIEKTDQTFKTGSSTLCLLRRSRAVPSSLSRTFSCTTSSCCGDHTLSLLTMSPSPARTFSRATDLGNVASSFLLFLEAFSGSDSLTREVLSRSLDRERRLSFCRSCDSLPFNWPGSSSDQTDIIIQTPMKAAKRSRRHDRFCDSIGLIRWSWKYSRAVLVFAASRLVRT